MAWSVTAFAATPAIKRAVIAAPAGSENEVERIAGDAAAGGLAITVVTGGATRAESVGAGLGNVDGALVAVHDAARPLVSRELIDALLRVLEADPAAAGVIAAAPVADTLKRAVPGGSPPSVERTEERTGLWAAQTPQVFRTGALREAHAVAPSALATATDDAMLVEGQGGRILIAESPHPNFKVTTAADLRLAEALLAGKTPA